MLCLLDLRLPGSSEGHFVPSSLKQIAAVSINKGAVVLTNSRQVNPCFSWGPGLMDTHRMRVCIESCIPCMCQVQSELPCHDMLGQLSAICVTVHIFASKLLLLWVVLCLLSAGLLGKLPGREWLLTLRWLGSTSCNPCSVRRTDWDYGYALRYEYQHWIPEPDFLIRDRFSSWEQLDNVCLGKKTVVSDEAKNYKVIIALAAIRN